MRQILVVGSDVEKGLGSLGNRRAMRFWWMWLLLIVRDQPGVGVVVVDGAVVVGVTELHIPNLEDNGPGLGKLFDLDLRLTYVGSVEP